MPSVYELRRRQNDFEAELKQKGWYHSFELPDGTRIDGCMSLQWERERWSRFGLPESLEGKRVLDIGSWDGWFSFEAERRGAAVTSVDCVEVENYLWLHERLGSQAEYRNLDLYELPWAGLGRFDVVFCLGVFYHLKHPLLGLEIVCAHATDVAYIETFVTDGETWREHVDDMPSMEFYEYSELNGQFDNWTGATVACLLAMCRAAGFARVDLLVVDKTNALVACRRKWEPAPESPEMQTPQLWAVVNSVNRGINLYARRDEYLACWFRSSEAQITREDLRLEVGEFGAQAVSLKQEGEGNWLANFRLPPGTPPGWVPVRLRLAQSGFSETFRIAIDMPVIVERLVIDNVFDGENWTPGEAHEYLSCWVEGLAENSDLHNVRLRLDGHRLKTSFVGEAGGKGTRQVNASLPKGLAPGSYELRVGCGGVESTPVPLRVV